ncbi:MAG: hypothetical protein GEU98_07070 [Pseudonocardiaceae bacterium]|nr:hypothetical protein [Pseudonocardiaceae bacterium]
MAARLQGAPGDRIRRAAAVFRDRKAAQGGAARRGRRYPWPVVERAVTVLTRDGCPACVRAEDDVRRICDELGVRWSVVDVDGEDELRAEYGDRVPVILIDGVEHGYWQVEEARFRAALSA